MSIYAADSMLRIECYLQLSLAEIRSCTYLLIFAQVSCYKLLRHRYIRFMKNSTYRVFG